MSEHALIAPMEGRRRAPWASVLVATTRQPRTILGLALVVAIVLIAVAGPWVAPNPATEIVGPPSSTPSAGLVLGTDHLGRDVLSRFLTGGREILQLATMSTVLGVLLGLVVGLTAAYAHGRILDDALMRLMDLILTFPSLVFALVLVAAFGPNPWLVILVVAITTMPRIARVMRAAAAEVVRQDYVQAAEAIGESRARILTSEVLPNVSSPLIVEATLRLTVAIGVIASLAFLGFGTRPPAPDWGMMISENQLSLAIQPWAVLVPVTAIAILTIGTSLIGDGLSRALVGIERSDPWR